MLKLEDIYAIFMLFAVWMIITSRLSVVNFLLGLGICFLVVAIIRSSFTRKVAAKVITNWVYSLAYIFSVAVEVFIASYKVAFFVLHPKYLPRPGIVKVPTEVGSNNKLVKLTLLANTITLTPGTVTVDIDTNSDDLYIHWMNIRREQTTAIREEIIGRFEILIRRIF